MLVDDLKAVVQGEISPQIAGRYLTLYIGEADWERHLGILWGRLERKSHQAAPAAYARTVAFAIMLPAHDRSTRIDPEHPENLLYTCNRFQQYDTKNWFSEWKNIVKRDIDIIGWRREALKLGGVYDIEWVPFCREAYNRMLMKAQDTGVVTDDNRAELEDRFRKLVFVYGGAVLSYLFLNHSKVVDRVLNWRSGYHVERAIFDTYTIEQVVKIKRAELKAINNKKLIKTA